LNTSLNLGGYPILNSMKHAKQMLDTTELDAVIVSHEEKLWIIR
jgi:predicted NodU family carbamoyl transferase